MGHSSYPSSVHITEEGPREGFQSEKAFIPTEDKVALINALSLTGVQRIQVASFVNPKKVPTMADAAAVVEGIIVRPTVEFSALWFNPRGLEMARSSGKLTLTGKINGYGSDAFLARNLGRTPEKQWAGVSALLDEYAQYGIEVNRIGVTAAFGCNFEGEVPAGKVLGVIDRGMSIAADRGLHIKEIGLSDTMGWANPAQISHFVGTIQDRYPNVEISLHLHDTRGMGLANAHMALSMSVTMFDTAIGGLGGCPFSGNEKAAGNICTLDLAHMCEELGITTGVDLEALSSCVAQAERIVGHPLPSKVAQSGTLNKHRRQVSAYGATV